MVNFGKLPRVQQAAWEQTRIMPTGQLRKIVCVEDEVAMIDLIRLILSSKGFEVIGADGGVKGLATIRAQKPDLVLLDLMMPEVDGWQVYQQLKADPATAEIPVIVVTAKAQNIDKVLGLHIAKVDDYISKPFSLQELVDRVDAVLKRREQAAKAVS